MRIIIDGDACPSIDKIYKLASKYNIELILVMDSSHSVKYKNINTIIVDTKSQSVDIKISNLVRSNDIVITQDYGLAVIALSKEAKVINSKGFIYDERNIDSILMLRHIKQKLRKTNIHIKGNKKRTKKDEENLINTLQKIIQNSTKKY